jgi:hypothetical protein
VVTFPPDITGPAPGEPRGLQVRRHQHHRLPPCGSQQSPRTGGCQVLKHQRHHQFVGYQVKQVTYSRQVGPSSSPVQEVVNNSAAQDVKFRPTVMEIVR